MARNKSKMTIAQKTMMTDFTSRYFELLEKYWNPSPDDEYWDGLTDDAMKLISEFNTTDIALNNFLQNIVVAFLNSREDA